MRFICMKLLQLSSGSGFFLSLIFKIEALNTQFGQIHAASLASSALLDLHVSSHFTGSGIAYPPRIGLNAFQPLSNGLYQNEVGLAAGLFNNQNGVYPAGSGSSPVLPDSNSQHLSHSFDSNSDHGGDGNIFAAVSSGHTASSDVSNFSEPPNAGHFSDPTYGLPGDPGAFISTLNYGPLGQSASYGIAAGTPHHRANNYVGPNSLNGLMPISSYSAFGNDATLYDFNIQARHVVDATGLRQWVPDLVFDMPDTSSVSFKGPTPDGSCANKPRALCHVCSTGFSRKADLERHMRMHQPRSANVHRCEVRSCIYSSYRKDKLTGHVKSPHSQEEAPA